MIPDGKQGAPTSGFRPKRASVTLLALILVIVTPVDSLVVGDDDPLWSSNWIRRDSSKCGALPLEHAEHLSERAAFFRPSLLPTLHFQIFQALRTARSWSRQTDGRQGRECRFDGP